MQIVYTPIGTIHTTFHDPVGMPVQPSGAAGSQGTIELFPHVLEGIRDLETFSHLILLYHFHQVQTSRLTVTPFLDPRPHGVFSTRAPVRPNAIGLSIVRLLGVEANQLQIENIDVLDGTPLLDIKPYVPAFDRPSGDIQIGWFQDARDDRQVRADDRFQ